MRDNNLWVDKTGGRAWGKAAMKVFGLGWALLNGYGQIVNGALIRANRLAFGWAEGYLCIGAASGQMANQASWHKRQEEVGGWNVKYNRKKQWWKGLISYQSLRVGVGKDRSRIGLVSNPYCFRIDPVSFSYRSPIVLLSFSLPEAETIRKQYVSDVGLIRGR